MDSHVARRRPRRTELIGNPMRRRRAGRGGRGTRRCRADQGLDAAASRKRSSIRRDSRCRRTRRCPGRRQLSAARQPHLRQPVFKFSPHQISKFAPRPGIHLPAPTGGDDNEILGNEILDACRCDRRAGRSFRCFCQQPSPRHDGLRCELRLSLGAARDRTALGFARSVSLTK